MISNWQKIKNFVRGNTDFKSLLKGLLKNGTKNPSRKVSFTIAIISLGAKLTKVDGHVTKDEIKAFREIFQLPKSEQKNAARVFNSASKSTVGYEYYAVEIRKLLGTGSPLLEDIMEGLIYIARADGEISFQERRFLIRVNALFGLPRRKFRYKLNFHDGDDSIDPYKVLGVKEDMPLSEIRRKWRDLVLKSHPDVLVARGVPEEAIRLSELQLSRYNLAWKKIQEEKQFAPT